MAVRYSLNTSLCPDCNASTKYATASLVLFLISSAFMMISSLLSFTRLVNSTEGFVFVVFWPSIVCLRFLVGEASQADGARVQSKVETQASRRETLTGSSVRLHGLLQNEGKGK